jgi:glycosyltransferase involved in cell wall biosynthesis
MSLVASMIVKNEMGRYLPLAVRHLLTYVDEIRVLDDGSDDGTFEWLVEETDERVSVLRNSGPSFFEHEGRARQTLLDWVLQSKADYCLGIDADEFIGDPAVIRDVLAEGTEAVYLLSLVEAWKADHGGISIRVDGLWGARKVPMLYQLPSTPPRRGNQRGWQIQNKQLACGREPIIVIRSSRHAPLLSTEVFHFGWTNESGRQARAERYFEHDGGNFHADRHLQSILFPDSKVALRGQVWPAGLRDISKDLIELVNA